METTTLRAVETSPSDKPGAETAAKSPLQPLDYAFQTLLQPLKKSLARIENHLAKHTSPAEAAPAPTAEVVAPKSNDGALTQLAQRLELLSKELATFRSEAMALLPAAAQPEARTAPPAVEVVASVVPDDLMEESLGIEAHDSWEEIILGSELSNDAALNAVRQQFLGDVIAGAAAARALAGQLLLLQTSPVEELPERFRHVGEAYYRWRPRTTTADDPLEQALASWLTRRAEDAGLRNSIQLVRPGNRFDGNRHSATTRGVEVVAVHGWVVLRDNQKVYTKASVTVQ